jgi:serine/threonine-protein kinase
MAEELTATAVGTLLNGTYRLERVIAEGGMGVVYEAAHVRLPRRFAVKVLGKPEDSRVSSTALQRFRREAEIASTLAHSHIVEVFDYQISDSGAPYLVMELLEGEDLADRLKRMGRLPIVAALRIVDEVAQALDVAHANGVVHRDLKPANIFLARRSGREDFVKVLDFGVSKIIDAATLTHEKAMVGTPLYMSPEQAVGTQELSPASDVFSLGSITYELLTGRRAFAASSIPSILYQIVHGPTPSLAGRAPGIGPAVDEVFQRVLAKKREERFQRAGDFAAALTRVIDRQSGQMPVLRVPTTPALDGNWPEEQGDEDLPPPAPEPSGLFKTGEAGATDVDVSTKAEDLMEMAEKAFAPPEEPSSASPSTILAKKSKGPPPIPEDVGARSSLLVPLSGSVLKLKPKRRWLGIALAASVVPVAVVVGVVLSGGKSGDAPIAIVAPKPGAALVGSDPPLEQKPPAPPPQVTIPPLSPETQPAAPAAPPEAPKVKAPVQFVFHVVPKNAEIRVDDRRVKGDKVTLPWQERAHRVHVMAPGYVPLVLTPPSTESRVFELHMERVTPPPQQQHKHDKPVPPSHDAAPVQEL